jgi:hypothetical protein
LEQLWEWNRKDEGQVMMMMSESPEMMGKQQGWLLSGLSNDQ